MIKRINEADKKDNKKEKPKAKDMLNAIEKGFGTTPEDKNKILQLVKGMIFSDDPKAKEFMKKLDKATTDIAQDVKGEKKDTKKDEKKKESFVVKEAFSIGDYTLEEGDEFIITESDEKDSITVTEEVDIPGTIYTLEEGDKIQIIEEIKKGIFTKDFLWRSYGDTLGWRKGTEVTIIDEGDTYYVVYTGTDWGQRVEKSYIDLI